MSDNSAVPDRAALDSTALLGSRKGELLAAADLGYFEGYWSEWIMQQVARLSTEPILQQAEVERADRQELKRRLERSRKLVNAYREYCSQVLTTVDHAKGEWADLSWLSGEDSRRTMATAIAAGVPSILITDNGKDFPLGEARNGVLMLSSGAFLDALYRDHREAKEKVGQYLARNPGLLPDVRRRARFEIISPRVGPAHRELAGKDGCLLFAWLWEQLSAYLGTPTAAALLRRAISGASESHPDLKGIVISRQHRTYTYTLPRELCSDPAGSAVPAFRMLVASTMGLVGAVTGGVLVNRLMDSRELSRWLPGTEEVNP